VKFLTCIGLELQICRRSQGGGGEVIPNVNGGIHNIIFANVLYG